MSVPDISVLQDLATKLVRRAHKEGTLHELTPRIIRNDIETQLSLEPGLLDAKEYRSALKAAIVEAQENLDESAPALEAEDKPPEEKPESKTKATIGKSKSRQSTESDATLSKGKKRKVEDDHKSSVKKKKPTTAKSTGKDSKTVMQSFKSAEFVPPSSDVEDAVHDSLFSAEESTPQKKLSKKRSSKPLRLSSPDEEPESKPSSSKRETASSSLSAAPEPSEDLKSESELSVLIDDEPPKQKKKAKTKDQAGSNGTKASKAQQQKKSAPSLSKDEERIKKLKSLILACGVRKVWSKVFKGIEDKPSQQIKMLRSMLADLGMTGRMSMEQAKAIRERRELAEELAEVQSFEKSVLKQSRGSRSKVESEHAASASESGDEEEDVPPAKRKPRNARQSIMAFLGDQSESE